MIFMEDLNSDFLYTAGDVSDAEFLAGAAEHLADSGDAPTGPVQRAWFYLPDYDDADYVEDGIYVRCGMDVPGAELFTFVALR